MIAIGITGSIASGKSTVAKFIAKKKYPLFSADRIVLNLYKNNNFINLMIKKFNLKSKFKIKNQIKAIIKKDKKKLKLLERIIHPLVRKEMNIFLKKTNKIIILEIPLFYDSNEVRQVHSDIEECKESILSVAEALSKNVSSKNFGETYFEEKEEN